jgi:hypothetical protein
MGAANPLAAGRVTRDLLARLGSPDADERAECRVRVAALAADADVLDVVGHEVEALYTNGPAGGGGVRVFTSEVIGVVSTLVPRTAVAPGVTILEAGNARPAA